MSKPKKADSGCFSVILRRLLCQGGGLQVQTHPSDHITEQPGKKAEIDDREAGAIENQVRRTPPGGIVARLMGLDSLPETNWVPEGLKTADSVTRSKSVNFMDYLLKFDVDNKQNQHQHRRLRTSVSFREVPLPILTTKLHQENQDLYVLYLDEVDGIKKKKEKIKEEKKKKINNRKNVSKFIDEPRRRTDLIKKKKKKPVAKHKVVTKSSEIKKKDCKVKSSSSLRVIKKKDYDHESILDKQKNDDDCYYKELVAKLCEISEEAIMQSNWVTNKFVDHEDFEEFVMEIGQHILDGLLQQLVDELGFNM